MFLKILQYSLKTHCVEVFLQAFRPATLLKIDSNTCFFCEYCEIFKNNFFYRTLLVAVSEQTKNHDTFFK